LLAAAAERVSNTGMRLSELAGLTLEDVDLDPGVAAVLGTGRRPRGRRDRAQPSDRPPPAPRPCRHAPPGQTLRSREKQRRETF
jgi:hypothetical protein